MYPAAPRTGRLTMLCAATAALLTACAPANAPDGPRATETTPTETVSAVEDTAAALTTAPLQPSTADVPSTVVLAGIPEVPSRTRHGDYRRAAFGETWTDDHGGAGGYNGCDTRNDILNRDLVDKTY